MTKKLWLVFCTFLVLVACTACGQAENSADTAYDIESTVRDNMTALAAMDDEDVDFWLSQYASEDMGETGRILAEALESWKEIRPEAGDYISADTFKETVTGKEITGTLRCRFTERDVDFSMTFSNDFSEIKGMSLSPVYTSGELLKRAGMNTLMGMGTVFAVLILMSLVIYAIGTIGRRQNKKADAVLQAEKTQDETGMAEPGRADEDVSDDLELAAVIAAAIAASENVSADSLVVRSIRRRKTPGNWKNI